MLPLTVVMMIIRDLQNLTHRIVCNMLWVCCQNRFNMRITGSWNSWKREEWVPEKKSWNKKAVFTKTSIVPTSEIHFWIFTVLKHLISGHIKMCSCQSNSQFRCENEFMSLSQKLSFIMMHPAHALARFKFYNQKPPPPIGLISPCFSSEPRRPLNVLLSTFVS